MGGQCGLLVSGRGVPASSAPRKGRLRSLRWRVRVPDVR
ncbi:hypothetical protein D187_001066 [Cystobacter fuscus DSM 2262]|uniref:Uncharacterized protein n=1 Tax=Cystobacter fuscus (strain ATCC 25194 / DSM 2262 / NBRC 100088 / M29) TaxID=1242864 RepID=S9QX86_CYSF2|nr:hypothetical protein D187_001066 [Cystobacter fuscus DSM 2262]